MNYSPIWGTVHDKINEDAGGVKLFVANEFLLCAIQSIVLNWPKRGICQSIFRLQPCPCSLVCFLRWCYWFRIHPTLMHGLEWLLSSDLETSKAKVTGIKCADAPNLSAHPRKGPQRWRSLKPWLTLPEICSIKGKRTMHCRFLIE